MAATVAARGAGRCADVSAARRSPFRTASLLADTPRATSSAWTSSTWSVSRWSATALAWAATEGSSASRASTSSGPTSASSAGAWSSAGQVSVGRSGPGTIDRITACAKLRAKPDVRKCERAHMRRTSPQFDASHKQCANVRNWCPSVRKSARNTCSITMMN